MTTQSKKAKGRNLQKTVVNELKSNFPTLTGNDIKSTSMGVTGEDVQLSPAAIDILGDLHIECKNVEKINIISVFQDTAETAKKKNKTPVIVHKRNRVEPVVVISLGYFMKLLKGKYDGLV